MILKPLRQKSKTFIFRSFDNHDSDEPAKIIFTRFPMPNEDYPMAEQKAVLDSDIMKSLDNSPEFRETLVDHMINTMVSNIMAGKVDYRRFFNECVERIEDLTYDGREIKTIDDFYNHLPEEASFTIAQEAHAYAKEADRFTAEYKKK